MFYSTPADRNQNIKGPWWNPPPTCYNAWELNPWRLFWLLCLAGCSSCPVITQFCAGTRCNLESFHLCHLCYAIQREGWAGAAASAAARRASNWLLWINLPGSFCPYIPGPWTPSVQENPPTQLYLRLLGGLLHKEGGLVGIQRGNPCLIQKGSTLGLQGGRRYAAIPKSHCISWPRHRTRLLWQLGSQLHSTK